MRESDRLPRRLVAILYADVAGYSRLTGEDEDATHRSLSQKLDLITSFVAQKRGRIMHFAGDAVLAMFEAVVDAVSCASEIQDHLRSLDTEHSTGPRVEFRIGINLGDVIEDRGDIYGDGVNVAARLEGLAKPGGMCISESVRTAIGKKLPLEYEFIGAQSVKNIEQPVRAYRVLEKDREESRRSPETVPKFALPEKPSIAVLPFDNISGDVQQDYFADGITEDIITALSRSPWLFVIARNSSFVFRGSAKDVKEIASDLGVQYVLEGSVRKAGNRIRVNAQLIDGLAGSHLWAEKYDGELEDIFDLQDDITRAVVASTQTQIQLSVGTSVFEINRPNVQTWELIARAWKAFYELTEKSLERAEVLSRNAIETDDTSCEGHLILAGVLIHKAQMGYARVPDTAISEAYRLAARAVALDDRNEYAHWILGFIELWRRNHERAKSELERAVELNPNCSLAYGSLGTVLSYMGEPEESIQCNEIAIRSNPRDPSIFFRFSGIAMAHFVAERYSEAAEWARKSLQRKPNWRVGHAILSASLGHLGRSDEAMAAAEAYRNVFPETDTKVLFDLPFKSPADAQRFAEGLRSAGLSE